MTLLVKSPGVVTPAVMLYPMQKRELVQVRVAFALNWRIRGATLRDLRFYCQFADITFQISTDGGWWQSRHVLIAQGENEQIETFVLLIQQLLAGQAVIQEVR